MVAGLLGEVLWTINSCATDWWRFIHSSHDFPYTWNMGQTLGEKLHRIYMSCTPEFEPPSEPQERGSCCWKSWQDPVLHQSGSQCWLLWEVRPEISSPTYLTNASNWVAYFNNTIEDMGDTGPLIIAGVAGAGGGCVEVSCLNQDNQMQTNPVIRF